jgi:hypothetical protein
MPTERRSRASTTLPSLCCSKWAGSRCNVSDLHSTDVLFESRPEHRWSWSSHFPPGKCGHRTLNYVPLASQLSQLISYETTAHSLYWQCRQMNHTHTLSMWSQQNSASNLPPWRRFWHWLRATARWTQVNKRHIRIPDIPRLVTYQLCMARRVFPTYHAKLSR